MDWTQALTVIVVIVGGFIYLISKLDANQKENNIRFNGIENRLTAVEGDLKNLSQRITDLKTDVNQRFSTIESYLLPRKVFHFEETRKDGEPKEN